MRPIDADALIADLDKGLWGKDWDKALAEAIIEDAPSVDAVEVVRCKECKHWICNPNTEEWGKCKWISDEQFDVVMNADDFCSYGEEAEK